MEYCNWEDNNWDTLIYSILQDNCILMLGPDAAAEKVGDSHKPLTEILANKLAEMIDPEVREKIDPSDLTQVAQFYCMEKGRNSLYANVTAFYTQREDMTSDLHMDLAALPFYLSVTTTPDNMFFNSLKKQGKSPLMERYHFNRPDNPGIVKMGTEQEPLVFYLYGKLEEPKSLLLTENDLLDFLVSLISEKPPLPKNIVSQLRNKEKSFLFLGFGFRHWYLRILLHVLQGQSKESPSFAMEQFEPKYEDLLRQTVVFFQKSGFKIHIFEYELRNFAKELVEKYYQAAKICIPRIKHMDTPEVFISHASENKDAAYSLYKKLEDAGLIPWLDKENLRGGEEWEKEIKKTIKNVDYVLVLLSKALASEHESYVFKEINHAMERKKGFRQGIRFIIPVRIDDCPLLEELEGLQTVDLRDGSKIDELIKIIQRDFERRRNQ
ncbi:MAG: toll/interleukin-1 receptor domain-containing protein [Candidatus Aminicenantes bacterium]|nr:MAG: toll/interleukin-1 receptor domain-containing protein [Candidatus Aminicenantes bacterium]